MFKCFMMIKKNYLYVFLECSVFIRKLYGYVLVFFSKIVWFSTVKKNCTDCTVLRRFFKKKSFGHPAFCRSMNNS